MEIHSTELLITPPAEKSCSSELRNLAACLKADNTRFVHGMSSSSLTQVKHTTHCSFTLNTVPHDSLTREISVSKGRSQFSGHDEQFSVRTTKRLNTLITSLWLTFPSIISSQDCFVGEGNSDLVNLEQSLQFRSLCTYHIR